MPNVYGGAVTPAPGQQGDIYVAPGGNLIESFDGTSFKSNVFNYVELAQPAGTAAATFAVNQPIWTAPNDGSSWIVTAVSERHTTLGTSPTIQIEVAGAGIAVASGVNQLTGTIAASGVANTTVNGAVIATPTVIAAGASINAIFAGTVTSLVGCVVTVALRRIS